MRILVAAPQPFYVERGTPIAVDLLCRSLSERGYQVDLVAYDIGGERTYPNFATHRVKTWPRIRRIKPGFSLKKSYCDFFMLLKMFGMLLRKRYDVIHAVEESAFIAMLLGWAFRVPYIYDMDSHLTTQLVNHYSWLRHLRPALEKLETLPVRGAIAVVPVCDALAEGVRQYRQQNVYTLKDITLVSATTPTEKTEDIRDACGINGAMLMYIGNMEQYQGIGLMLKGFACYARTHSDTALVIIGGESEDIAAYQQMADELGIAAQTRFLGKRPVDMISAYMKQADILVSPRVEGVNTPMKIYSYLDSGVAVLATDLPTHNQVMDKTQACLVEPTPQAFAEGIEKLLGSQDYRLSLAQAAGQLVAREHSYDSYCEVLYRMYDELADSSTVAQ
jgi:glycosyltransferase involved in cell wall biosynthesis